MGTPSAETAVPVSSAEASLMASLSAPGQAVAAVPASRGQALVLLHLHVRRPAHLQRALVPAHVGLALGGAGVRGLVGGEHRLGGTGLLVGALSLVVVELVDDRALGQK